MEYGSSDEVTVDNKVAYHSFKIERVSLRTFEAFPVPAILVSLHTAAAELPGAFTFRQVG